MFALGMQWTESTKRFGPLVFETEERNHQMTTTKDVEQPTQELTKELYHSQLRQALATGVFPSCSVCTVPATRWLYVVDDDGTKTICVCPTCLYLRMRDRSIINVLSQLPPNAGYVTRVSATLGAIEGAREAKNAYLRSVWADFKGLDLSPFMKQVVKTQNSSNGELSHGVVA